MPLRALLSPPSALRLACVFQPAAKKAGLSQTRPYDLRHSFVSLLIAERRTIIEVARQAGHSPTMTLDTYGHVFDELEDAEPVTAEELIRQARAGHENGVSQVRPERSVVSSRANRNPAERGFWRADARTRTADPFITSLRTTHRAIRPFAGN